MEIDTPYGTVEYPVVWKDRLVLKENTDGEIYSMSFFCNLNECETEMFRLIFNDAEIGDHIGNLTIDEKTIPVNVLFYESSFDDSWTEEDRTVYYAMAEGINTVISSVICWPEFAE